jgi:transcriptional regulator with XRE-family HTH domain
MTASGGFDRSAFAGRLSTVLDDAASSTHQIARATGVSRNTLNSWATGRSSPQLDRLAAVTEFLEVDLAWVLFGHEPSDKARRELDELEDGIARLRGSLRQLATDAEALARRT